MRAWRDQLKAVAVAWAALRVLSCGGETFDPAGTPDPDEGTTFSAQIEAAQGGTVSTTQGAGTLTVAAGSLGEDGEVTLRPGPAEAGSVTSVYDVGPAGVTFDLPAHLSLAYDGDPGPDRTVVLASLGGGTWTEVAGSGVNEGRVTGPIAGSGRYGAILKDVEAPQVIDCAKVLQDFAPCGGAIAGTWRLLGSCAQGAPFRLEPPAYCPDRTGTWSLDQTGIVSIGETAESVFLDRDVKVADFQAPSSCFPEGISCKEAATVDDWATTCRSEGGGCHCSGLHSNPPWPNAPVPLTIDGNDLVLHDAAGSEIGRQAFCVQGTSAVIRATWTPPDGDPIPVLWVLSR